MLDLRLHRFRHRYVECLGAVEFDVARVVSKRVLLGTISLFLQAIENTIRSAAPARDQEPHAQRQVLTRPPAFGRFIPVGLFREFSWTAPLFVSREA